ncbi:MAG: DUF1330 domain-containing protein [Alphaproteobacteria bacterium]|nr:DUF1330 domain-containing protein [Alphaproteobacteria bacterium]
MPAYAVGHVAVTKPEGMKQYRESMPALLAKYGARMVINDRNPTTVEGPPRAGSVVVIEFSDLAKARAFYADPDYAAAKASRTGAGEIHLVICEGFVGH